MVFAIGTDLWSKHESFRSIAPDPVRITRAQVLEVKRVDPRLLSMELIPRHDPLVVVPHVLELKLVLNPGAVFGMGPGQRWFFVGFTFVAIGFGVWMFLHWTTPRSWAAHVSIALILGGGLGNLYDRLTYACVRDFIHPLPGVRWPFGWRPFGSAELWPYVSNLADLYLLVGIVMLLALLWKRPRHEDSADPSRSEGPGAPDAPA